MQLIPDWAPNIHPMIVHFPIVLLIGAVFFDLLNLFFKRYDWLNKSAIALYLLGTVAILITFFTGRSAADGLDIPVQIIPAVTDHADWAELTLWFFIVYSVIRFLPVFWFKSNPDAVKKIVTTFLVVIAFPGVYLLYETADHGAKLVFGYGLGTGNLITTETQTSDETEISDSSFIEKEDGSWKLISDKRVVEILSEKFRWIESSLQELNPMYDSNEGYLMFHLGNEAPASSGFVYDRKFNSVQVTAGINIDDLNGELELLHHFSDINNYDFLRIGNGKISLARKVNGAIKIFDENNYAGKGWIEVKVISDKTHFRGYVNNKLIMHGHGNEAEAGNVGIKLYGTGVITLKMVYAESIQGN